MIKNHYFRYNTGNTSVNDNMQLFLLWEKVKG